MSEESIVILVLGKSQQPSEPLNPIKFWSKYVVQNNKIFFVILPSTENNNSLFYFVKGKIKINSVHSTPVRVCWSVHRALDLAAI